MEVKSGHKMSARLKRRRKVKARIRHKLFGTLERPRVCVYRSLKYIYVQCVNDETRETLIGLNSRQLSELNKKNNAEMAFQLGEKFGKKMIDKGIQTCLFDRSGYLYHGRIKQLAEGIRKSGVKV